MPLSTEGLISADPFNPDRFSPLLAFHRVRTKNAAADHTTVTLTDFQKTIIELLPTLAILHGQYEFLPRIRADALHLHVQVGNSGLYSLTAGTEQGFITGSFHRFSHIRC